MYFLLTYKQTQCIVGHVLGWSVLSYQSYLLVELRQASLSRKFWLFNFSLVTNRFKNSAEVRGNIFAIQHLYVFTVYLALCAITYTQEVSRICKSMQKFIEKNVEMYNNTCVAIGWPNK